MEQPDLPGMDGGPTDDKWFAAANEGARRLRERRDFTPVKCECCDTLMDYDTFHNSASIGDEGTYYEDKTLCESCYSEDQPEATLRVFDAEHPDGEGDYGDSLFEIGATRNTTANDGDIGTWRVHRERIDGWRSYVKIDPPKDWVEFHSDCALFGSADSKDLERFDLYLRKALVAKDMRLIRASAITTNVCATNIDYFIEKKNEKAATVVAEKLAAAFRDPVRFNLTAITGKDPEDADFGDHLVAALGAVMLGRKA